MARGTKLASVEFMNQKSLVVAALAGAALASALLAPSPSSGQVGGDDPVVLTALLNEVTAQQATVVDNQTKIDAKLAAISDTLRLARIYVGRGGGKVP